MQGGVVTNVTGVVPCTAGVTWNFTAGTSPTVDGQVACSIPGNAVATQKITFPGGALQQCNAPAKNVSFVSFPTGNQCTHQVQAAVVLPAGEWKTGFGALLMNGKQA